MRNWLPRDIAVRTAVGIGAVHFRLAWHLDGGHIGHGHRRRSESGRYEESLVNRPLVWHPQSGMIRPRDAWVARDILHECAHGARSVRGSSHDERAHGVTGKGAGSRVRTQQPSDLSEDLVGLVGSDVQAVVACEVEFAQPGAGSGGIAEVDRPRHHVGADMAPLADPEAGELANERVAAAMRRLPQHHAAEGRGSAGRRTSRRTL